MSRASDLAVWSAGQYESCAGCGNGEPPEGVVVHFGSVSFVPNKG
jgi:hypothetical protein